jgi:hypothetical protein
VIKMSRIGFEAQQSLRFYFRKNASVIHKTSRI